MNMRIKLVTQGHEVTTTTTMNELKGLIRHLEAQGYSRTNKGPYNLFYTEVHSANGIALVKNTVSDYDTVAIFLNKIN